MCPPLSVSEIEELRPKDNRAPRFLIGPVPHLPVHRYLMRATEIAHAQLGSNVSFGRAYSEPVESGGDAVVRRKAVYRIGWPEGFVGELVSDKKVSFSVRSDRRSVVIKITRRSP